MEQLTNAFMYTATGILVFCAVLVVIQYIVLDARIRNSKKNKFEEPVRHKPRPLQLVKKYRMDIYFYDGSVVHSKTVHVGKEQAQSEAVRILDSGLYSEERNTVYSKYTLDRIELKEIRQ